jgi:hypothetical protein
MISRSRLIHYVSLAVAAAVVFAIAAWVALNAIEAVPMPPVPPSKADVTFNPQVDVRNHPLFNTLRTLTRGKVMAGVLGKVNPFLGGSGSAEALQQSARKLGTIEEVSLGGGTAIAIASGAETGMVALVRKGQAGYEVWRFTRDGNAQSLGNWSVEGNDPSITPVALQEDRNGDVWLLSAGGRIGSLQSDGRPLWGSVAIDGIQTAIAAPQAMFALDGAGRMWMTDGRSLFVGNGIGFQRIDLAAQLSSADRQALGVAEGQVVPEAFTIPRRIQTLADGRIAILTSRFIATFPLNLQGAAAVTVAEGNVVAVEPEGALWSVTRDASGAVTAWTRSVQGQSQSMTNLVVLPKQAGNTPALATIGNGTLYAFDYAQEGSVLWRVQDGVWVVGVLSPEGPQPQDRVEYVVADREGAVWALLAQRGVLLLQPSE